MLPHLYRNYVACLSMPSSANQIFVRRSSRKFEKYLSEQQFSKTIKENLMAGLSQWTSSNEEHPILISPTRGRVAPLEQVATSAFSEQSLLGWEAALNGHLSLSWRKALLFGSSTGDVDEVKSILRQLIKKLFHFSLSHYGPLEMAFCMVAL